MCWFAILKIHHLKICIWQPVRLLWLQEANTDWVKDNEDFKNTAEKHHRDKVITMRRQALKILGEPWPFKQTFMGVSIMSSIRCQYLPALKRLPGPACDMNFILGHHRYIGSIVSTYSAGRAKEDNTTDAFDKINWMQISCFSAQILIFFLEKVTLW